jgi:hypothetical protein
MYGTYVYNYDGGTIQMLLTNLDVGNYDFYLYGHSGSDDGLVVFQLWAGARDFGVRGTTVWGNG